MEQKILSLKDDKINSEVELIEYPVELRGGRNYILIPKDIVSNNEHRRVRIENGIIYWEQLSSPTSPYGLTFSQPLTKGDYIISFKSNTNMYIRKYIHIHVPSGTKHFSQAKTIQIDDNVWLTTGLLLGLEASGTYFNIYGTEPFNPTKEVMFWDFKLEKGSTPTDWTPAPEDLGLTYPDFITEFKPSISDRYILTEELIEGQPTSFSNNILINEFTEQ